MSMEIKGSFTAGLLAADLAVKDASRRGLLVAGEHILGVSGDRVPHETGELMRSGATSQDDDTVAVSYDTDYAVVQHEDTSLNHDSGRQAKFLESAFASEQATALRIIGNSIRKVT